MNVRICHSKAQRPKVRGMILIGVSHSLVVGEVKGYFVCTVMEASTGRLYRLHGRGCSGTNFTVNSRCRSIEFVLNKTFKSQMTNWLCALVYLYRLYEKERAQWAEPFPPLRIFFQRLWNFNKYAARYSLFISGIMDHWIYCPDSYCQGRISCESNIPPKPAIQLAISLTSNKLRQITV